MKNYRLAALVVTHNRLDKLRATISALLASSEDCLQHLLIYDNASGKDTQAWLQTLKDNRVEVLRSESNLGGAGGFERGLRHLSSCDEVDWIVVMDDDAKPVADALERFHSTNRDHFDAWLAAVHFPDRAGTIGRYCEMNRPWINPFWSKSAFFQTLLQGRNGFHIDPSCYDNESIVEVDGGSFVGFFISRAAVKRNGFPDGRLFIYGDDVIYTLALSESGEKIAFDPGIKFEHDCDTYHDDKKRAFNPIWKAYYACRNGIIFYRRAAGPFFPLVLPLIFMKWVANSRHYKDDRKKYYLLLCLAIRDGVMSRLDKPHSEIIRISSR